MVLPAGIEPATQGLQPSASPFQAAGAWDEEMSVLRLTVERITVRPALRSRAILFVQRGGIEPPCGRLVKPMPFRLGYPCVFLREGRPFPLFRPRNVDVIE